jgi:putative chitinase
MTAGLQQAGCTNPKRIAMFIAQTGEESAGFSTTTEFASGAEYEGRCSDLGNCSPGDGMKYKGRTWIQVTGRAHYAEFSQWAFGKGLVPSPTFFVDNPTQLSDIKWAGVGAAWYWTVSRPQINSLCDAGDIVGVTRAINGGTNGLQDRTDRYNRALPLGDQLLALITPTESLDPLEELLMANPAVPSLSIYANPGEDPVPILTMIAAQDAHGAHEPYVEKLARKGDADSLMRVARTAAGRGTYGTAAFAVQQAAGVLADVESTNPSILQAFLKGQSA